MYEHPDTLRRIGNERAERLHRAAERNRLVRRPRPLRRLHALLTAAIRH
jgi:hypothetical protein